MVSGFIDHSPPPTPPHPTPDSFNSENRNDNRSSEQLCSELHEQHGKNAARFADRMMPPEMQAFERRRLKAAVDQFLGCKFTQQIEAELATRGVVDER